MDGAARTTAACRRSYRPAACEAAERCRLGHRISDHSDCRAPAPTELRAAEPTRHEPWRASPVDSPLEAVARRGCRVDRRHRGRDRDDLPASSRFGYRRHPDRRARGCARPGSGRCPGAGRRRPGGPRDGEGRSPRTRRFRLHRAHLRAGCRVPDHGHQRGSDARRLPRRTRRGSATERARSRRPTPHPLASLLVGVRGSDTLEFVGSDGTYTCPSTAEMKLTVNDVVNLEGNAGQFRVKIFLISGG